MSKNGESALAADREAVLSFCKRLFDAGDDHFVSRDEIVDCWESLP